MSLKTKNQHRKSKQNMDVYKAISENVYPHGELADWDITELHSHMKDMIRDICALDITHSTDKARIASKLLAMGWHRKETSIRIVQQIVETLDNRLIARQSPLVAKVRQAMGHNNTKVT